MPIMFNAPTKHGRQEFLHSVALAFEDENAEAYFVAAGHADETSETPIHTYPKGTVEIDPLTTLASTGKHVLPELAAQHDGTVELSVGDDAAVDFSLTGKDS